MARTSGETLSTSFGNPCSLARYISPSNSSRTGQKSFSNASRLENIAVLPVREDAMQFSNEGLTLPAGSSPGGVASAGRARTARSDRLRLHPSGNVAATGTAGILLNEVRSRHPGLPLVFPPHTKVSYTIDQDCAWQSFDEQFRDIILRHPFGIIRHDLHDVGRFAGDRDLPRPGQRRSAVLAFKKRPSVFGHFGIGQLAKHRPRQHTLDEHVAVEDHLFAFIGAKTLKDWRCRLAPLFPAGEGTHDGFHVGNPTNAVTVVVGPVEAKR